ncbi:MAG: hypothetical protein WA584_23620 [Pyrinomonadaceae bacterium]
MANLTEARTIAESIVREMTPFAERVIIAGSIRRGKSSVKDIEIVAVPKWDTLKVQTGDLFEPEREEPRNLLWRWALAQTEIFWIKPGTNEIIGWLPKTDGRYWHGIIYPVVGSSESIKLDLFLCKPENWGVISTIRTGPADFSQALVSFIKFRTPYRVKDGNLMVEETEEIIPCAEEEDFFRNAGLTFVPLAAREAVNPYSVLKSI